MKPEDLVLKKEEEKRMNKSFFARKSIYRKILMIFGVLQMLFFFVLPYTSLGGVMGGLNDLAGQLGAEAGMETLPGKLTGFNAVKLFMGTGAEAIGADSAGFYLAVFLIPMIAALLVLLMHLFGRGKLSYVGTILISIAAAVCYGLSVVVMQAFVTVGYKESIVPVLFVLIAVVQLILAIAGCVADKGEAKEKTGSTVKQGKHDGVLIGIQGTYEGARIPLKDGKPVCIGRDPKICSIVIKGENISRKHCTVTYNAGNSSYSVTDLSVNGVYDKNGSRLEEGKVNILTSGNEIHIGASEEIFRLG